MGCQVLSVRPDELGTLPASLRGVRIAIHLTPGMSTAWPAAAAAARGRGATVALHIGGVPLPDDPLLSADADPIVLEPAPGDLERLAFDLKRALSSARGQHPSARLLVAAPDDMAGALGARGLAPYVDGFIAPSSRLPDVSALLAAIDPAAGTIVRALPADAGAAAMIAGAAAAAAEWLPPGLVAAAERPLACASGGRIAAYLNPQTLDLVGVSRSCPAPALVTGDVAGVVAERLELGEASVFRLRAGSGERFAEGVTVGAARALTAGEIVARHQAAAARQAAAIRTEIDSGTLTLTFEAPGFVAPVTVTSETTIFRDRDRVDLRHTDIRVNGVRFSTSDGVPRLPIIEPERAAAVPLAIALTDAYRYELAGREAVDGRSCYVIAFTPARGGGNLFGGRAWIDAATFGMVRVSAAQTGLKGPIVASEQTDVFAPDADGRWLLARSDIRQTYEGAGVRTPIHRLLMLGRHDVNAADFTLRRSAAYASSDVMLRDTAAGFRYLRRETVPGAGRQAGDALPDAADRQRVVAPAVTRIRTLAAGVIVDPNISTPLPFAGLSYVDFDLFHTGTQFSGFFGGSYAQLAFSAPSVRGSRWQLAGRAFGIATSYNDRAFVEGRERYERDIRQRPAQAAVWLLRPIASRASVRVEYDWDYNRFGRTDVTDPAFVIPRNQNAHGVRAGVDFQRAGWQASIWGSEILRIGWRRWGIPGSGEDGPPRSSFQRVGGSLARTAALSPRLAGRAEVAYTGGWHLDRFSRTAFGAFDNRLHGYPSALIRYDRGAVVRTSLSWAAARAVRLDAFGDTAAVRDPGFGPRLRSYTGAGAALECPAPLRTLLALEWGYGAQGVNTNGRRGTHVVRITGYKVF